MFASAHARHLGVVLLLGVFIIFYATIRYLPIKWIQDNHNRAQLSYFDLLISCMTQIFMIISLPLSICNIMGVICFSLFPEDPLLTSSPLFSPFLCFRVVTRGIYPELVRENVAHNMDVARLVGLENFIVEVVTDKYIVLPKNAKVKQTVVPQNYFSRTGNMFKARALQYCLEDGVNMLNNEDWIVHLDEETRLTTNCVIGILNFVSDGKSQFGQGAIVYTNGIVINWWTTLIDSIRVAFDYGCLRFCLKTFHKPFFNWKGSFVVAKVDAERDVSFDHGPEGSIAEDCFFGAVAISKGYRFDFIDGHMCEQSTFTLMDYVRQRKRWFNGILLTVLSPEVKYKHKVGLILLITTMSCMPATTAGALYTSKISTGILSDLLIIFISATYPYLFVVGLIKSLNMHRFGTRKRILLVTCTLLLIPVGMIMENVAILWGLIPHNSLKFYIVRKTVKDKKCLHDCDVV